MASIDLFTDSPTGIGQFAYITPAAGDPGSGNWTLATGTSLEISDTAQNGQDIGAMLDALVAGNHLHVYANGESRVYSFTSGVDNTAYHTLTVALVSSSTGFGVATGTLYSLQLVGGGGGGGGSGTVTSVAVSGTDGIEVDSGSPITTAGTITLGSAKLLGIEAGATADQTAGEIEAIVSHDNLQNIPVNDHLDWTADQGATNIDVANVPLATISAAGLAPTLSNVASQYLNGVGGYTVPAGGSGITPVADIASLPDPTTVSGEFYYAILERSIQYSNGTAWAEAGILVDGVTLEIDGTSGELQVIDGGIDLTQLAGTPTALYHLRSNATNTALEWVASTGGGDVTGPAGGTADGDIAVYDDTTGKLIRLGTVTEANVVANNAKVSYTDGAAVGLNTTHRTSAGTDHSDVGLNNTHRTGSGSDHADVAANTTAISTHEGLATDAHDASAISVLAGTPAELTSTQVQAALQEIQVDATAGIADAATAQSNLDDHELLTDEHIDWTTDQAGASTVDVGNVPEATISAPGLLPTLSNVATEYLNGEGNYTEPPGTGTARERADAAVIPATITATTLITTAGTANIDADLIDYQTYTFDTDLEIYINGDLMRNGAGLDVYGSAIAGEQAVGAFYCTFDIHAGDVIQMFYGTGTGGGGGSSTFIGLTDVAEPDFTGHAGHITAVNAGQTAIEFVSQRALYHFGGNYSGNTQNQWYGVGTSSMWQTTSLTSTYGTGATPNLTVNMVLPTMPWDCAMTDVSCWYRPQNATLEGDIAFFKVTYADGASTTTEAQVGTDLTIATGGSSSFRYDVSTSFSSGNTISAGDGLGMFMRNTTATSGTCIVTATVVLEIT